MKRVLRNLISCYEKLGLDEKKKEVQEMYDILNTIEPEDI